MSINTYNTPVSQHLYQTMATNLVPVEFRVRYSDLSSLLTRYVSLSSTHASSLPSGIEVQES